MAKEQKDKEKDRRPSSSTSTSASTSYKLGSRSCQGCYQRKVRCDRGVPCANCSKHGATCVYPGKGTNADVTRKIPNLQNISTRLGRLEILLSRLVERSELAETTPRKTQTRTRGPPTANANVVEAPSQQNQQPSIASTWEILLNDEHDERQMPFATTPGMGSTPQNVSGQIRQSASKASLSPFQQKTPAPPINERHDQSGAPVSLKDISDVQALYPNTQLALQLWSVYVKSVDPVLKILHIPTVQSIVVATILDPKSAVSSTLALTFSIYYAAVTTLCHDEDGEDDGTISLPCEKQTLLGRFKTALDRLLTVANLVSRPEIASIQALAIYVTCLRVHEVGRSVWILNGLAIRLAQSMGLHRDGASLKLSPFETEMRLRLWWHLCVLDSRAPEDQGLQPTIAVTNWELRLPLNVNDTQLYPDMMCLPAESHGWTEMSFFLVQTEACRRMHPLMETQERHSASSPDSEALIQIQEKRRIIRDPARQMLAKFGVVPESGSGAPTDLSCIAIQHVVTACKKMEFVLQLREEIITRRRISAQQEAQPEVAADILKPSFELACDVLESSRAVLRDSRPAKFSWFFTMYTQWYALAYVLRCLCCSPYIESETERVSTERAWTLVAELFPRGLSHSAGIHDNEYDDGSIWSYLHRLRQQALFLREHARLAATGGDVVSPHGRHEPSEFLEAGTLFPGTSNGMYAPADLGQEFDTNSNQSLFSSLDLFMADIQFLPDWDTVINM